MSKLIKTFRAVWHALLIHTANNSSTDFNVQKEAYRDDKMALINVLHVFLAVIVALLVAVPEVNAADLINTVLSLASSLGRNNEPEPKPQE
ncbi:hypothetical protein V5799_016373 [Amblyomma americanum]|uniref:Uncharacterized protein n=1 Tax=Amblyomma americanum TaxID=6943 RepID=A0AAQ4F5B9_AMBAM